MENYEDNFIFDHYTPTYDTFLKSLGLWEYSGSVSKTFVHHQDDQPSQECPKTKVLEDFRCLGGDFVIVSPTLNTYKNAFLLLLLLLLLLRHTMVKKSNPLFGPQGTSVCQGLQ